MQVGNVVTLPSVVATTPGGMRVTIGYGQRFLVECRSGRTFLMRAMNGGRLLTARFWVSELALEPTRFTRRPLVAPRPSRATLRRARCHGELDRTCG